MLLYVKLSKKIELIHEFLLIATSATDIHADSFDGIKIVLANEVRTFFFNGKPAVIIGLGKLRNPPS